MDKLLLRFIWVLLLALACPRLGAGQAMVQGIVADGTGQPLPYVPVLLLRLPDSVLVGTQATTIQGVYRFEQVPTGHYALRTLPMGFAPARYVLAVAGPGPVVVPLLRPQVAPMALKEVLVQGRPPMLEQHADRTVVNVDRLNATGDNALEVLRKAPGITLDKDDHIVYRGSTSMLVLLDGKQTYLSGDALSSYLKSLPATALSQIELLPTPPASMDAAGTAGVINLRTRRIMRAGLTGTATAGAGYGRYEKGWVGANLAYNVGKLRTFGRLDLGHYNSYNILNINRLIRDTTFAQENYSHPINNSFNYAAGADAPLSARQTLGVQVRGALDHTDAQFSSQSVSTTADGRVVGQLDMSNPQTARITDLGANLNYRFAFDSTGRELTADADLVHYTSSLHQQFNLLNPPPPGAAGALSGQERSDQSSDVLIRAVKADYLHPLTGTPWRAEAGAKASWVTTRSAIAFDQLQQKEWQPDPNRSNQFQYDEVIEAGYASVNTTLRKWELKAGLRGEHTYSLGKSPTASQRIERNYFQLFPSAFVSHQFGEHDQISLAAGRRITRPTYQNLNPFISYTDAYSAIQGNPFLLPSLANSFVFNYVHRDFQVLSLSYLRETNVVNLVTYQNDQTKVTTTRPENLDQALTLSLTSGGHTEVTKWWGMDNQLVASYGEVQSQVEGQQVELHRFSATLATDHTFRLPQQYQLLVSGSYNSPSVQGLYYLRSSGYLNIGFKKPLWNGRATLSLRASDLLHTNRYRSIVSYNNINMIWNNQWESRRVSLTLTMKLGGGKTHTSHANGSSDEEGRAGH